MSTHGFDTTCDQFIVDARDWARQNEVIDYAVARGITTSDAIRELVNKGLSHLAVLGPSSYGGPYEGASPYGKA